jgi:hypothetical protein
MWKDNEILEVLIFIQNKGEKKPKLGTNPIFQL